MILMLLKLKIIDEFTVTKFFNDGYEVGKKFILFKFNETKEHWFSTSKSLKLRFLFDELFVSFSMDKTKNLLSF